MEEYFLLESHTMKNSKTFKVKKQLVIGEMCRTSSEYYKLQNNNNKGKFLYNQQ